MPHPEVRPAPPGHGTPCPAGRKVVRRRLSVGFTPVRKQRRPPGGRRQQSAGARWNPPRCFPTIYTSIDPHTALDEVLAHFRHYAIPIESAMPRVTVAVRVELARVLDLTDGTTRSALRVSERRMLGEPSREEQAAGREALTQAMGRLAHELGWEALVVPSAARRGGVNLIIFPDNLAPWGCARDRQRRRTPRPGVVSPADLHADP